MTSIWLVRPHAGDLAQRGVRLLRRHRPDLQADPTLLGGARDRDLALPQAVPVLAHGRRLDLRDLALAAVAHELADRRHEDATPFESVRSWSVGRCRSAGAGHRGRRRPGWRRAMGPGSGSKMGPRRTRRGRTPPEATNAECSSGPTSVSNVRRRRPWLCVGWLRSVLRGLARLRAAFATVAGGSRPGVVRPVLGFSGPRPNGRPPLQERVGSCPRPPPPSERVALVVVLVAPPPGDRRGQRQAGRRRRRAPGSRRPRGTG